MINLSYSFLALAASILAVAALTTNAYAQSDITVLSHRFNNGYYGGEMIGEIRNNGTSELSTMQMPVSISFYDDNHSLVSSEAGYVENHEIDPGNRSAIRVTILNPSVLDDAETYDVIVDSKRLVQNASLQDYRNEIDAMQSVDESLFQPYPYNATDTGLMPPPMN